MRNRQQQMRTAWVLASLMLVAAPRAFAQDTLTRAKGFYASADYEEALTLLETLKGKAPSTEVAAYHVFCLVALGRSDEARVAIEGIVRTDPLFRPSEAQASPRVRSFYEDVRRPLLPDITRQLYAKAKGAYDQKSWAPALADFDRVIALVDEIVETDASVSDLRTLAGGFRDLTKAALAPPPPPPAPEPAPVPVTPPPPPPPAEPEIYGVENADVKRPIPLDKTLPPWRPENPTEERMSFSGAVELVVGENGRVLSAKIIDSVHPRYDAALLAAAQTWTFRPATKNGVPVKYRYAVGVKLGR